MRCLLLPVLGVVASFVGFVSAAAGQLQQISGNFGPNPNNVGFFYYRPANVQANPALIVAVHYCSGSAQAYFTGTPYANLADQGGFIVIFPNAPRSGGCFDVHSQQTLTHNGGGDSQGIASMVQYAIRTWNVDANRVFITGLSSGAMMTNVMLGSYPDLFKAATAYAGVPFGCFAGTSEWSSQCANGQLIKTGQQWGDMVRAAFPGFNGTRPRFQFWHGTNDETLNYQNFKEEIKEWTNVFGVSETASTTTQNTPRSGVTKTTYGNSIVALSVQGGTHNLPIDGNSDLEFFGLTGTGAAPPTPVNPPTTSLPTSTSAPAPGSGAAQWAQCGGIGFAGPTSCISPFRCIKLNDYYSQCQ